MGNVYAGERANKLFLMASEMIIVFSRTYSDLTNFLCYKEVDFLSST